MQKLQAATPNFGYKQIRRTDLNLWVQEFKKCKCILGLTVETIQSYLSALYKNDPVNTERKLEQWLHIQFYLYRRIQEAVKFDLPLAAILF